MGAIKTQREQRRRVRTQERAASAPANTPSGGVASRASCGVGAGALLSAPLSCPVLVGCVADSRIVSSRCWPFLEQCNLLRACRGLILRGFISGRLQQHSNTSGAVCLAPRIMTLETTQMITMCWTARCISIGQNLLSSATEHRQMRRPRARVLKLTTQSQAGMCRKPYLTHCARTGPATRFAG